MAAFTPAQEAQLAALRTRRSQVVQEIASVTRDLAATQRSLKTLQDRLLVERDPAAKDLFIANITNLQQQEKQQAGQLAALNQELQNIDIQINQITSPRPGLTAQESAGVDVSDDAAAAVGGARTQNPPTPVQILDEQGELVDIQFVDQPPSNASRPALSNNTNLGLVDGSSTVGGDNPVRTVRQTQPGGAASNDDAKARPPSTVGIASGDDRPGITQSFLAAIEATPNLLARLASMTYTISIYLLNDGEYRELLAQNRKVLPNSRSLIIQSAGIPQSDVRGTGLRNPYFDLDFYIDDLQINNLVAGPAGVGAHTSTTLDFTVIEPYGITFLPRLKAAVQNNIGTTENINELCQNFLMVIRFYGYDDQGRLLNGAELGVRETGSDTSSILEKWIPFNVTDINYRIASKVTEYRVKAVTVDSAVAFGSMYGTIPFNFELTSDTVQDLLNGQTTLVSSNTPNANANGTTPAPPKASAIPEKKTYAGGLCNALNQHEAELVRINGFEIANRYIIELVEFPDTPGGNGIRDAKVVRPGRSDKSRGEMNKNQEAAQKYLSSKTSYNKEQNNFSIVAGTQIVQLIDLVMRTSSYITSQQTIQFDPKTGEPVQKDPVSVTQWYRIRSQSRPLGYDRKRRDFAYEIKYIVSPYQINDPRNAYFPSSFFRGPHKTYNYWFTGENSEVLDFQIDVNTQFYMTVGNDGLSVEPDPNAQYLEKRAFQARPGQTTQPGSNEAGMPAANLADRIYSPIDVAKIKLEILGDPDWIQQTEVFYKDVNSEPFAQDGSVNYDASEIIFEINFNPVSDYDLSTGIMDSHRRTANPSDRFAARPQQDFFRATEVHSYFKQGKFTQQIEGLIIYPDDERRLYVKARRPTDVRPVEATEGSAAFGISVNGGSPNGLKANGGRLGLNPDLKTTTNGGISIQGVNDDSANQNVRPLGTT